MNFSEIIVGVMRWGTWGANYGVKEVQKLIAASLEQGFYTFDHADIYGGYTTEELFGNAFSEMKIQRENLQLITKCGICYPSEKKNFQVKHYDYSKEYILQQVDESLQNLKTDYIDVLLLHRPSPLLNPEEVAAAFGILRSNGKVKDFGVSNFNPAQFNLLHSYFPYLITNQVEISLTETKAFDDGSLEQMMQHQIKPMAWSALGNYFSETSEKNQRIKAVLKSLSEKYNANETQLLLAFLRKHPSGILPIVGTTKPENFLLYKKSLGIELSTEDWFALLEASKGHRCP